MKAAGKPQVHFFSMDTAFRIKNKSAVAGWLLQCAKSEGIRLTKLFVYLCGDKFLLDMNHQFLGHDYLTDVITFDFPLPRKRTGVEIFVSIPRVRENAKKYKSEFEDELHRVLVHGLLHVAGFKDKTKRQKAVMRKRENACLALRDRTAA